MPSNPPVIVFDLGAVLIDWDPRHMYRKLIGDEATMEWFLSEVTTPEWNGQQDAGRSWDEAVSVLTTVHPEHAEWIAAYRERWEEMLNGPIEETVAILRRLKADGIEVHALTNWSAETFPIARERYDFLDWFEHIVVSGEEGVMKPDRRIYDILLDRIGHIAGDCVFVDDNARNVAAALDLGFDTIHFTDPDQLTTELMARGLLT